MKSAALDMINNSLTLPMRTLIVAATLALSSSSALAFKSGDCVFPKTKMDPKTYHLVLPAKVNFYATPEAAEVVGELQFPVAFSVVEAKGKMIKVKSVPEGNAPDGKVIGWGKANQFEGQELRNCNL